MAGRPFWSGQFKISLVSFGIQLFPATNAEPGISFHQIDRVSGKRVHHLNVVNEDEPVEKSEIVKGFEYSKGKYLIVEQDEIDKLRVPTKSAIAIRQFVDLDELSLALFDKPYFVVPDPKESLQAFAVVRKALEQTKKAAIGEVAFGGREHLIAFTVPSDKSAGGLMAYTLRYGNELRASEEYFANFARIEIDKKQLAMATELIHAYSAPFEIDSYKDDYEEALHDLIEAKQKDMPLPLEEERAQRPKVVNLMDALRRSVNEVKDSQTDHKSPARPPKKGPVLVGATKRRHRAA
ncbi:MAG: Ku protein [Terracidiphilus sp.]|jgi:DNA end-binding protein Ku